MSSFAELLRAIASLLWPVLMGAVIWFYREEIRSVLKRLSHFKKGKIFGQEVEMTEELDFLQRSVVETAAEIVAAPVASLPPPAETTKRDDELAELLLGNPTQNPKVALILLASKLEQRLRILSASTGWSLAPEGLTGSVETLERYGQLPKHATATVKLFSTVRAKLIHDRTATDDEVLRAIDSGISLLKAIDSIPIATHTVVQTDVPIYSDAVCQILREDVRGVILEETSALTPNKNLQIFPTTETHFRIGQKVSWQWNMSKVWGASWYRKADTQEISEAWHSSAEFVGRSLDTF